MKISREFPIFNTLDSLVYFPEDSQVGASKCEFGALNFKHFHSKIFYEVEIDEGESWHWNPVLAGQHGERSSFT